MQTNGLRRVFLVAIRMQLLSVQPRQAGQQHGRERQFLRAQMGGEMPRWSAVELILFGGIGAQGFVFSGWTSVGVDQCVAPAAYGGGCMFLGARRPHSGATLLVACLAKVRARNTCQ